MIKLFVVDTMYDDCYGFKNVPIRWFVTDRRPRPIQPYESVIANYSTLTGLTRTEAEDFADELFSEEEAQRLFDYLVADYNAYTSENTKIISIELPISENSAIPSYICASNGPKSGFRLDELSTDSANYTLPFKVGGLVDTDGCLSIFEGLDGHVN